MWMGVLACGLCAESGFVANSGLLLIAAAFCFLLVMGQLLRETSISDPKQYATICLKTPCAIIAAMGCFWLGSYHLMFSGVDGGYAGVPALWHPNDAAAISLSGGYMGTETMSASASHWLFYTLSAACCAALIASALVERIRAFPALLFGVGVAGLIYPISAAWSWGGGWLQLAGYVDIAGAGTFHLTIGWAALCGLWLTGKRTTTITSPLLPTATVGTLLVVLGVFGLMAGLQQRFQVAADAAWVSTLLANGAIAMASGMAVAMVLALLSQRYRGWLLHGALAGMVSLSADPLSPLPYEAAAIAASGSFIAALAHQRFTRWQLDDPCAIIPIHLVCALWSGLTVCLISPQAEWSIQLYAMAAQSGWVIVTSAVLWSVIARLWQFVPDAQDAA